MSLINKLNNLLSMTPDEIAKRLNNRGWMEPRQLGQEIFDKDKARVPYCYCLVRNGEVTNVHDLTGTWKLSSCSSNYDEFCDSLQRFGRTYWIIPFDQYTGELPLCTTT